MGKKFYAALVAIPVIVALLVASPLLLRNEIPVSATTPLDHIEIEYTKHQLKKVSHGITERVGAQKSETLFIKNDGSTKYTITEEGYLRPDQSDRLEQAHLDRIKALIKETGFIAIPSESFPVLDHITEYQKSNVKVTLNGKENRIHWPEQNATERFIPPIITMVESELDAIMAGFAK